MYETMSTVTHLKSSCRNIIEKIWNDKRAFNIFQYISEPKFFFVLFIRSYQTKYLFYTRPLTIWFHAWRSSSCRISSNNVCWYRWFQEKEQRSEVGCCDFMQVKEITLLFLLSNKTEMAAGLKTEIDHPINHLFTLRRGAVHTNQMKNTTKRRMLIVILSPQSSKLKALWHLLLICPDSFVGQLSWLLRFLFIYLCGL